MLSVNTLQRSSACASNFLICYSSIFACAHVHLAEEQFFLIHVIQLLLQASLCFRCDPRRDSESHFWWRSFDRGAARSRFEKQLSRRSCCLLIHFVTYFQINTQTPTRPQARQRRVWRLMTSAARVTQESRRQRRHRHCRPTRKQQHPQLPRYFRDCDRKINDRVGRVLTGVESQNVMRGTLARFLSIYFVTQEPQPVHGSFVDHDIQRND